MIRSKFSIYRFVCFYIPFHLLFILLYFIFIIIFFRYHHRLLGGRKFEEWDGWLDMGRWRPHGNGYPLLEPQVGTVAFLRILRGRSCGNPSQLSFAPYGGGCNASRLFMKQKKNCSFYVLHLELIYLFLFTAWLALILYDQNKTVNEFKMRGSHLLPKLMRFKGMFEPSGIW